MLQQGLFRVHRFCVLLACLTSILLLNPQPIEAVDADKEAQETPYRKTAEVEGVIEYMLDNGCRVVLIPDESSTSITVNMTVLVGSRHEGYGEAGMAHLLEHMLFKGTPSHGDIDKELKERGVLDLNGTTDYDRTNYFETLPASDENLEWTIAMEADRLLNCYIRGEDLFSEMTVVRNEFESGEDSPSSILMQRIMANAYEWHNYGKSVIGNRADIERVPVKRLRDFYKKYYRPDNVVLFVAGKFKPEQAIASAAKHFGTMPVPNVPLEATYTMEPTQDGERIVYLNRTGDVAMVGMAYHVPSMAHAETAPLVVLEHILGTEPTGRLYQELVKTKMASTVIAMHQAGHDPGLFGCLVYVNRESTVDACREAISKLIENVVANGVTDEELERAVREIGNRKEDMQNNTASFAYELSDWAAYGDWRLFFLDRDRIQTVTVDDVKRVALRYFKNSNRTTGIFVPTPDPDRSSIPQSPNVDSIVAGYKGRDTVLTGEVFAATPENVAARVFRGTLPSGVKYAMLPKQVRGDKFVLKLTLRFGSEASLATVKRIQASKILGDAWMLGAKNLSEAQIQDALESLQAECAATSDAGSVTFQVSGKKKFFDQTIELLTKIIRSPTFPKEEFDLLKTKRIADIEAALTDPSYLAQNTLSRKINPYPESSVHYIPTGKESIDRLASISDSDVRELYQQFVGGTAGELSIVGAFEKDAAIEQFSTLLNAWKSQEAYTRIAKPYQAIQPETLSIETPDKENATYLAASNLQVRSDDPEWEAMFIANDILGGGSLSSRLGERVREQEGLSYGIGSQFMAKALDRSAVFMTYAITNPANRDKVVSTIDEVYQQILKDGITEAELESSKTSFLKGVEESLSDDSQLMATLHQYLETNRDEAFLARRMGKIEKLTVAEVQAALAKLLDLKGRVLVTAGDFANKASQ